VIRLYQLNDSSNLFFGGLRWEDCAKIEFGIRMNAPVLCFSQRPEAYAFFFDPKQLLGKDGIIVVRDDVDPAPLLNLYFDEVERLDHPIVITHFSKPAVVLNLFVGRKLRAIYPWIYGPYPDKEVKIFFDEIRSVDQARIRVRGWAAEIGGSGSPITILGFVNGAKVLTVQTRGERPDVAAALNLSIFAAKDVSFDGTLTCRRGQQLVIVAVTASNKYVLHPHRLFCP
jgi:hypothetical protein